MKAESAVKQAPAKNGRRYLDQTQVTHYAKLCALLKKWEARREVIRAMLLEGFAEGRTCPTGGPYLIEMIVEDRRAMSWKDEWQQLAKTLYGGKWRLEQQKLEDQSPRTQVQKLTSRVNPDYRLERPDSLANRRRG